MVFGVTAVALATGQVPVAIASVAVALIVIGVMLNKLGYFQPRRFLFRSFVTLLSSFGRFQAWNSPQEHGVTLAHKKHI